MKREEGGVKMRIRKLVTFRVLVDRRRTRRGRLQCGRRTRRRGWAVGTCSGTHSSIRSAIRSAIHSTTNNTCSSNVRQSSITRLGSDACGGQHGLSRRHTCLRAARGGGDCANGRVMRANGECKRDRWWALCGAAHTEAEVCER